MIQHKHLILRLEVKKPPMCETYLKEWMIKLVKDLKMELFAGPITGYVNVPGNRGLTGVCIISTSHIALHCWDESNPALIQLDIFTCGDMDMEVVANAIVEFEPCKIEKKFLDREHGLVEVT